MLEKHYGPSHSASTPEPRRGDPDSIRRNLGVNLEDSLFETGGSRRHQAPMPTQGMSLLHAERHERQEMTRQHFAKEKERFEQSRMEELDRMNQEFERMAQKLAEMRIEERDLDQQNNIRKTHLEHVTGELSELEDRYSQEHARLTRKSTELEDRHAHKLQDARDIQSQLEDTTQRMMDERSSLAQELDDLRHAKTRQEKQQAEQHRREAQRGFGNVNGGVYGTSSGASSSDRARPKKVTIADPGSSAPPSGGADPAGQGSGRGGHTPSTGSGSRTGRASTTAGRRYSRRESMSPGMRDVYDSNPYIAEMGVDCVSRNVDNAEIVDWSVEQSRQLHGHNPNAARRVASKPSVFTGQQPWQEWFADFMDDMRYNRWSSEEALDELIRALRGGPGKLAISKWRTQHGRGTFTQLVQTASYLIGNVGNEDPLRQFRKRTQKPQESHRVFGLELQNLLQRARPRWELDDPQFLDDLFSQFIEGLRDSEHRQVACDSWKQGTSLTDLFMSVEDFDRKRSLLSPKALSRTSCVLEYDSPAETEEEGTEEEGGIGAVSHQDGTKARTSSYKFNPNNRKTTQGKPKNPDSPSDSPKTPTALEELVLRLTDLVSNGPQGTPKPKLDKSTKKCYRCQQMGHFASECTAVKPVPRKEEKSTEN